MSTTDDKPPPIDRDQLDAWRFGAPSNVGADPLSELRAWRVLAHLPGDGGGGPVDVGRCVLARDEGDALMQARRLFATERVSVAPVGGRAEARGADES